MSNRLTTCGTCGRTAQHTDGAEPYWQHVTTPATDHRVDPDDSYVARD